LPTKLKQPIVWLVSTAIRGSWPENDREEEMAVVIVTRLKGNHDHTALVKEGAAILKRHGVTSVRAGRIFSGPHAGQLVVVATKPDMAAFGRSAQGLLADAAWLKYLSEMSKVFELQDRSITLSEDF
jgi:hypothetical protein